MSGEGGESVPERKINTVVAYAPIKDADITVPLYPSVRYDEVKECKNDKVKLEKYLVWKLLEKIVESTLNIDFANVQFTKTDNGKWVCPDFYFSLSHTDGLVCVALSGSPIGVDTELVRDVNAGLAKKILTEREVDLMADLPFDEQNRYLLESWVKKESIFKKTEDRSFFQTVRKPRRTLPSLRVLRYRVVSTLYRSQLITVKKLNLNIWRTYEKHIFKRNMENDRK